MNSMGLKILVNSADKRSVTALEAMEAGQYDAALDQIKSIAEEYEAFCAASTDEATEQKQDDEQAKESTDEKGCVGDEPHSEHCVPS